VPVDHLTHHADTIGDRVAVIDDRGGQDIRTLDYTGFNALTNRLANGLATLGIRPDEHVAWWGENSLETLCAMHAIRKAGAVSVPIPYRSTDVEATYLLGNADVVAIIVDASYAENLARIAPELAHLKTVVVFGGEPAHASQERFDDMLGEPTTPAAEGQVAKTRTMIYTSGTTGRPKGAIRRVGGTANEFNALLEHLGMSALDPLVFLTTGPLYHSGPSGFALRAQVLGGTIVTQHHFDAED